MWYFCLFLIGFGLAVSGGVTLIAYFNYLPAGVSWAAFLIYIKYRIECYFLPIGFLLMFIAIRQFPNE